MDDTVTSFQMVSTVDDAYSAEELSTRYPIKPHIGNIIRLGTFMGMKFAILKGWYVLFPLFIQFLIVGINGGFLYFFGGVMPFKGVLGMSIAATGLFMCVLLCTTLDPGYLVRSDAPSQFDEEASNSQSNSSPSNIYCHKCKTLQSDAVYHDSFCDLCVQGYDHFCIVLGNIIGKNNLKFFYSIFVFYVANVGLLVLSIIASENSGRP